MARLLGEARVSVLPDGTRFKPETEATVKKAVAGISAQIPIALNSAEFDVRVKAIRAKIARSPADRCKHQRRRY